MFIYFWETERDRAWAGEGQRKKETQNLKQAPGPEQAVSTEPDAGLEPTNCEIMTWAKLWCSTDWATLAPLYSIILSEIKVLLKNLSQHVVL